MSLAILVRNAFALLVGAFVSFFYSYGFGYVSLAFSLLGFFLCFAAFGSMVLLKSDRDTILHTAARAVLFSAILVLAVVTIPPFAIVGETRSLHDTYIVYPGYRDILAAWIVLAVLLMVTGVVGLRPRR